MIHPKRQIGVLKCDVGKYKEVEMNHHRIYYESIFKAMKISAKKNHDYAGGDSSYPLSNFK